MDTDRFSVLRPTLQADRRLLVLDLEHGKANEMGSEQLEAYEALCQTLEADDTVRCLCTTSHRISKRGKPIFIAGANVTERVGWDDDRVKAHVIRQRELMRRIARLPVFHVALVHGVALGWGAEYLLTADYVLVTPTASFALPETGLGILPGANGTADLALRVGPAQALRLGMTGEVVGAEEGVRIGLAQESVADLDAGARRVEAMADRLALRSPTAVAAFKRALLDGLGRTTEERVALEARAYEHCVDSGQATIGRASFDAIRAGDAPDWGPRAP